MTLYVFYFFAAIQIFLSWKSLEGGLYYLRFFRNELGRHLEGPGLRAAVIVPCRGRDPGLKENLEAVMEQDHSDFEVIFVTDSADDPSCEVIREVIAGNPQIESRLLIAGSSGSTGQKVRNLIDASAAIGTGVEALVFVDSDARPSPGWLSGLLKGLDDNRTGCSSGYRWFVPQNGGLASHLRSAWNASIASVLGPNEGRNFAWGGSMAILRETFEDLEVARNWEGKLTDDFSLTRMIRRSGGSVRFVPACLTASVEDCTFRELFEFTTRQMKITRVYRPDLWIVSLSGSLIFAGTVIGALILLFYTSGVHFVLVAVFLSLTFAAGTAKAALRVKAVEIALPQYRVSIRRQYFWHSLLWSATPFLFLWNDVAALVSRRIVWRGIEYVLKSPEETIVVRRGK